LEEIQQGNSLRPVNRDSVYWYHVTVTIDRNSATCGQSYVDGSPFGSPFDPTSHQGSISSTAPLRVGSVSFELQTVFLGGIDEVEVFGRQLTAAEVQGIYAAQSTSVGKCECNCPFQGNFDGDGFLTALDLRV